MLTAIWIIGFSVVTMWIVLFLIIKKAIPEAGLRRALFFVGALMPIAVLIAAVRLVFRKETEAHPCPAELLTAEKEVDAERVSTFGGRPMTPRLSEAWHAVYLRSLEKTAITFDRILNSNHLAHHHG